MSAAVELARAWLPPALFSLAGRWSGRALRWEGVPPRWEDAVRRSTGYDDASILQRVAAATREVVAGRAAYERDSVLFQEPAPPSPLLFPLLRHALRHPGPLDVVDFGGSLGSTYRLCRAFLPEGLALRWTVVEQPAFVAAGQAEFATEELRFAPSLDALPPAAGPRLLLASSVLQYLQRPAAVLDTFETSGAATLVVDRTPVWDGPADALAVQHVPPHIYRASYPCWILSRPALLARWRAGWRLVADVPAPEGRRQASGGPAFEFRGFILERDPA